MRQVGHLPELYVDARSEKYKFYTVSYTASELTQICRRAGGQYLSGMQFCDILTLKNLN